MASLLWYPWYPPDCYVSSSWTSQVSGRPGTVCSGLRGYVGRMNLEFVRAASRSGLADFAVATAGNSERLLHDAKLLAGSGSSGRAYSLAVLAIEATGKTMGLTALACFADSVRQQAPLHRLLEWHELKIVSGLLLAALPYGTMGARIAAMPADELARTLGGLAPADEYARLKMRGFYVDMCADGTICGPPDISASQAAGAVGRSQAATDSIGGVVLRPWFRDWLADPPAECLDLSGDLFTALTQAGSSRTPEAATEVIRRVVAMFRASRVVLSC